MIYGIIRKLPLSSERKMKFFNCYRDICWRIKFNNFEYEKVKKNLSFCGSNSFYGHEYWLKKYSGYNDYVYGVIEHGLYFGNFREKDGNVDEYDFGSILTYGEYRVNILKEVFPSYNIVGIGPYIHYAETDMRYYNELRSRIDSNYRTIALYPDHCAAGSNANYVFHEFISQAMSIANEVDAKNILISMHPNDIALGLHKQLDIFRGKNIILVTGGSYHPNYLPRVRAIMSLTDIIFSNAIGTYLGYGVYFEKPIIIDISSNHRAFWDAYKEEQKMFAGVFNGSHPLLLTPEQKELCDYYFGYNNIKTPDELYGTLENCKKFYREQFK